MKYKKTENKYSISLIASVIFHLALGGYLLDKEIARNFKIPKLAITKTQQPSIRLDEIKFITKKELAQLKQKLGQQVVANENAGKNTRPENSRFLGEKDQSFDRQTIASRVAAFKEAGLGNKNGSLKNASAEEKTESKRSAGKKEISFSELGYKLAGETTEVKESKSQKIPSEALGLINGKSGVQGLAANSDYVEDIPLGDMTNLNTTEFKYYGFYHRIRQKLEQYWGSTIQSKAKSLYKSGRRLPASENLITAILVTLDNRGNIVDIKIEGTSGIRELDQAAIESFNKAGPFPNPPKGLLVDGRATIQWGFVVKS